MNYQELLAFQQQNILTDLTLILSDNITKLSINVHKVILAANCTYFKKLFIEFSEKDKEEIILIVPDVNATYDIIMSFYGQTMNNTGWKHILQLYRCYDFFGLKTDISKLIDMEVPVEGFDLLLDVIELIGYTKETIKIINKNLPRKYDLSKFPNELLQEMINMTFTDMIVSGDNYEDIKIWDSSTGELIKKIFKARTNDELFKNNDHILSVCLAFNNKKIITAGTEKCINIWDIASGKLVNTLIGHTDEIHSVSISPNNKIIASGSNDCTIKLWNAQNGKLIHTLTGHTKFVKSVCFSFDSKQIVSGSTGYNENIKIWNTGNGKLINTLRGHEYCVESVCFSPDNKRIASGGRDNNIKIWNSYNGMLIRTILGHTNTVTIVQYSHDQKYIVSCSYKNIKLWDALTGEIINTLIVYDSINDMCFSRDNKKIISCSGKDIKIWDTQTGKLINTITEYGFILSICYSNAPDEYYQKIVNNLTPQQKIDLNITN